MKNDKDIEIRQDNAITTARYEMTLCQMDVLFCLMSVLNKDKSKYLIYVKNIEKLTNRKWNYNQLREATYNLNSKVYEIKKGDNLLQVSILASSEYIAGQGAIELELSSKIKPYLFDLKKQFTSFKLHAILMLSSKYAKRIYMIANRWKAKGEIRYTIDMFKEMLYLKDPKGKKPEQYVKITDLKKRVLDPSVDQINRHTDLEISYLLHKKGRSYDSISFKVLEKPKNTKLVDFKTDEKSKGIIEIAQSIGITRKDILANILESSDLQKLLRKYNNDIKLGNYKDIKNKAGYFISMIEKQKNK